MASVDRHVVLAGVSVRALAQSAARAGYRVTAIDAFGDADLRAVADVVALRRDEGRPYSALRAARAAYDIGASAAAYTAPFENHPDAVAQLAAGRRLLGNTPEVVVQVRRPLVLARALRQLGFAVPAARASAPPTEEARRWLVKPRRSGGGHGMRRWRPATALARAVYLQEWIAGTPGSLAFAADGRQAVPLGVSRQLVGDVAFGARGFRYCGSLIGAPRALFTDGDRVQAIAAALADAVTAEFGLVGVNGIDFIARDGIPYPIEVNPRYSASMELIEQAYGVPIFDTHVRACRGELPKAPALDDTVGMWGKAIVFARQAVRIGHTTPWTAGVHADLPHPGERIRRGHAICTVFARAPDTPRCRDALVARADGVTALAANRRGAA